MISITEHPFFCKDESEVNTPICKTLDKELATENGRIIMEKKLSQETDMKRELVKRTHTVEHLSSKIRHVV